MKVGGTTVSTPGYCLAPPQNLLTPALTNAFDLSIVPGSSATNTTARDSAAESPGEVSQAGNGKGGNLRVLDRAAVTPEVPSAKCPTDWASLQVGLGSPTQVVDDSDLTWTKQRAQVRADALPEGTTLRMQLICRPRSAKAVTIDKSLYGSIHNDRL